MARCLRCHAGNEWIDGTVPSESTEATTEMLAVARDALSNISFDIRHGRFNEALAVVGPALRQLSRIAGEPE